MVALAGDPSEYVRVSLAEALGLLGGPGGTAARGGARSAPALRSRAGWLGRLFGRGGAAAPADPVALAVSTLRAALADPAPAVRAQAAPLARPAGAGRRARRPAT